MYTVIQVNDGFMPGNYVSAVMPAIDSCEKCEKELYKRFVDLLFDIGCSLEDITNDATDNIYINDEHSICWIKTAYGNIHLEVIYLPVSL